MTEIHNGNDNYDKEKMFLRRTREENNIELGFVTTSHSMKAIHQPAKSILHQPAEATFFSTEGALAKPKLHLSKQYQQAPVAM